mgnify:FL=1
MSKLIVIYVIVALLCTGTHQLVSKALPANIIDANSVAVATDFRSQVTLEESTVLNTLNNLVQATKDSRSIAALNQRISLSKAVAARIKITIECCKPFKITIEW